MKKAFCDVRGCNEIAHPIVLRTGKYHHKACAEDDEGWVEKERDMCWHCLVVLVNRLMSAVPEDKKEEVYEKMNERFLP